jgi:hypothetical protein
MIFIGNYTYRQADALLVTIDVQTLYKSIPHGDGIIALKELFIKTSKSTNMINVISHSTNIINLPV